MEEAKVGRARRRGRGTPRGWRARGLWGRFARLRREAAALEAGDARLARRAPLATGIEGVLGRIFAAGLPAGEGEGGEGDG